MKFALFRRRNDLRQARMTAAKSIHNPCPVCGKPRGKGAFEFAHGTCAEVRAKTEGKKKAYPDRVDGLNRLTVENTEKARNTRVVKRYLSGDLPHWMTDK